jgi:alkylated DNA nucleotide flippase Atl1
VTVAGDGPAGDPARVSAADRRRLVGLVPQTAADLLYLETVRDECAAADAVAGRPGAARMVGAALKVSTPAMRLPWQRVVGSLGRGLAKINILDPIGGAIQRAMLEAEGVRFSAGGAIALADHGWLGGGGRKRRTARRRRRAAR